MRQRTRSNAMRMLRWLAGCVIAWSIGAGTASAAVDCSRLPEGLQARCEEVVRVQRLCAGQAAEDRQACEKEHFRWPIHEDCSVLPDGVRAMCIEHNRLRERDQPCAGMSGADLDACARSHAGTGKRRIL